MCKSYLILTCFKVFGHERVSILRGGLRDWKLLNYDVESGRSDEPNFGTFDAKWDPRWIMSYSDVFRQIRTEQFQIVDVRSKPKFDGERKDDLAASGGRIKGSTHLPVSSIFNENTWALKSRPEIRQLLKEAGITREKPKLIYGDAGLEASTVYLAMIQENFRAHLYNGGWIEWSHLSPADWMV